MPKLEQVPIKKINTLTANGKFAGHKILDEQRHHLEPEELLRFFTEAQQNIFWYSYFYIEYYFGCRVSEPALILEKDDISFKDNLIVIRRLKKRETATGFKESVYGLTDGLKKVIQTVKIYKKVHDLINNPFLFASPTKGGKIPKDRIGQLRRLGEYRAISRMSAHKMFIQFAKKAKLPEKLQHSHVLRHTRATLMLAAGAHESQVQFLLGHNNINTTRTYIGQARALRMRYQTAAELGFGLDGTGLEDFGSTSRPQLSNDKDFRVQHADFTDTDFNFQEI